MIKVAGDTSTCPPPESVTMEQTVTERKRQGKCPEKERSSMAAREDRKQKLMQGKTTWSNLTPQRLMERRGAGSGGCARACDRSLS